MKKIVVLGVGGIGGYYGGLLAKYYAGSDDVEIYFIARSENELAIREHGLHVESTKGNFITHPKLITSNAAEIGIADLLIICTKSYGLEEALRRNLACINNETVILPLLNGVNSRERIKAIVPENEVWEGCVYAVSRLVKPGFIKETGIMAMLCFGAANGNRYKLTQVEKLLKKAGIDAELSENIHSAIWKKFIFISSVSTLLTCLDTTIGEILVNPEAKKTLLELLHELKTVAEAKRIPLPEDIIEEAITTMSALPYDTTSSMYNDYQHGKNTEVESLTGYVVREASNLHIPVPQFERLYKQLLKKVK